ncbi:MAG: hypothetical protein OJF49_001990 [Ktedonobacterales bacterium]|jgi:hypothetical protein|nr:MAG: hypothetical protein OJF49_001990 [Ktedonobacterales bacterium]
MTDGSGGESGDLWAEQERERRLAALRTLAGAQQAVGNATQSATDTAMGAPPVESLAPPTTLKARGRRRVVVGVACALLAMAVVAGGLVATGALGGSRTAQKKSAAKTILVDLLAAMGCPQAMAWSPDGKTLAVLGTGSCPGGTTQFSDPAGKLALVDAATGRIIRTIKLDPLVLPLAIPASVSSNPNNELEAGYGEMIWSPDGKEIAITFGAGTAYQQFDQDHNLVASGVHTINSGLALVDVGAQTARVLMFASEKAAERLQGQQLRWDVTAGMVAGENVPQGLAYRWNGDGSLTATQPLSATPGTPQVGPAGNADGGAAFTMWRTGGLALNAPCPNVPPYNMPKPPVQFAPYFALGLYTTAWSPDGRYVQFGVNANGKLAQAVGQMPPVDPQEGAGCGGGDPQYLPKTLMPLHDAVLAQVAATMNINNSYVQLAWSADGTLLAAGEHKTLNTVERVDVRDCASGKVVATLQGQLLGTITEFGGEHDVDHVAWSPKGTTLAVLVQNAQRLVLWRM